MATINGADRSEILRTTFGSDVIFGNYALDRHAGGDAVVPQLVTGGGPDPETDPEPFVGSRDSKRVLGPDLSAGADPYIGDEPDPYIGDEPDPDIGDESPSGGSHPGDPERGFVDPEHPEREFQAGIVETGGKGVDFLTGGAQDDVLMGGGGDDNVFGDGGDDNVWGEDGDDIVLGGGGDDKVIGGEGADWLLGGGGDDKLVGGLDKDTFEFLSGSGKDQVWDFMPGEDILQVNKGINGTNIKTPADLANGIRQVYEGTVVDLGKDNSILLLDVKAEDVLAHPDLYFFLF